MAARKFQTRREAGIILAICGIISGLLSAYVNVEAVSLFGAPMLPAVFFGIVVALGIYSWEARHPVPMLIVFVGVCIAWWLAWRTGSSIYERLTPSGASLAQAGIVAGLVGALITAVGLWIASEDFRQLGNVVRTAIFGAAAGALLYFLESGGPLHGPAPLFVVWQAGMAGLIGYALAYRPRPD
jgi:hypothetical protein